MFLSAISAEWEEIFSKAGVQGSTAEIGWTPHGELLSRQGQAGGQRVLGHPKQGAQPWDFGLCMAAKLFLDLSPSGEAEDVSPAAVWGNSGGSGKWGLLPSSFQETTCFRQKAAGKLWLRNRCHLLPTRSFRTWQR